MCDSGREVKADIGLIFLCAKYTNTKIQIDKYTNTEIKKGKSENQSESWDESESVCVILAEGWKQISDWVPPVDRAGFGCRGEGK